MKQKNNRGGLEEWEDRKAGDQGHQKEEDDVADPRTLTRHR